MAKNIVFCADGTWNGIDGDGDQQPDQDVSNVFKLFANLLGTDVPQPGVDGDVERERVALDEAGSMVQVAKYLHGVGDSRKPFIAFLGGALGVGLIRRIVRGYTFISRNYQPGDRISIVGFSRGAYTARAVAGLIAAKGLLNPGRFDLNDKEKAYHLGLDVWLDYRRGLADEGETWLAAVKAVLLGPLALFASAPKPADMIRDVPIQAVGVWDTVGSLGVPVMVAGKNIDLFRFASTVLSTKVQHGFHALSLDEQRKNFEPTLWNARAGVEQILFPGAHADVGGGYPGGEESRLSDGALAWMQDKLSTVGVRFAAAPTYPPAPAANGPAHQPWMHPPFDLLPHQLRTFPQGLPLHPSVSAREAAGPVRPDPSAPPVPYAPANRP